MTESDTDLLIKRAQAGDRPALAELFERYRFRLERMVDLRLDGRVRARFDAADVVQEAYVEMERRLQSYEDGSNLPFFLWLRMITGDRLAHLHRMHLGAEKRNAYREVGQAAPAMPEASNVHLALDLAGQFTSVDRNLKREEVTAKLKAALSAMDATDREVIAMRHFEELSTGEIAAALDITRSGVLKRYMRAIRRLGHAINSTSDISLP